MPINQPDRIAFSLAEVQANAKIKAINTAKAQIQASIAQLQALDTANDNLFIPANALINEYQNEFQYLDGNVRSVIVEQDIQDSANKKFQNHFFPNDPQTAVPALSTTQNVWTQFPPFASTYAVGLNYVQVYPSTITYEVQVINNILAFITAAGAFFDIENTSGQHAIPNPAGTCSISMYTDEATCVANSGIWTPGPDIIESYAAVVTLKNNIVAAVNSLVSILNLEVAAIPTNDPNSTNQTQNNAAITYINSTFLPAINAWLANPDFNPVPGSVTTIAQFYAYNSNLLAPTKLHSTQLATLHAALSARLTFTTTRIAQLNTVLGSISQNISDGTVTSSGLYGERFGFLALRLHILTGSLIQLNGLLNTTNAQTAIAASIAQNRDTYYGILPTSALQAPGNGTATISLVDVSFLSVGDIIHMVADNQPEITRGIKSINVNSVVLSDVVPPQISPATNGRLYKDLT